MGLKPGMGISLVLAGLRGSRDLTLGCMIWYIYGKELLRVWWVCWGGIWAEGGFTLAVFQGYGGWEWSTVGTGATQF